MILKSCKSTEASHSYIQKVTLIFNEESNLFINGSNYLHKKICCIILFGRLVGSSFVKEIRSDTLL